MWGFQNPQDFGNLVHNFGSVEPLGAADPDSRFSGFPAKIHYLFKLQIGRRVHPRAVACLHVPLRASTCIHLHPRVAACIQVRPGRLARSRPGFSLGVSLYKSNSGGMVEHVRGGGQNIEGHHFEGG